MEAKVRLTVALEEVAGSTVEAGGEEESEESV